MSRQIGYLPLVFLGSCIPAIVRSTKSTHACGAAPSGARLKAQSVLESQWLLVHDGDSGKSSISLKPHIQQGDRLLVQKVTDDITDENLLLTKDELKNLFDKAEKKEQDRADEATAGLNGAK